MLNKNFKNIAGLTLALVITLGVASTSNMAVQADEVVNVKVDGKQIAFPDEQPYVNSDNRTMVPVRFVTEAMNCDVKWEDANQLVIITKGEKRILLQIGHNWAIINDTKTDVRKEFDTRAVLKNERTMVPLRFISETLGAGVAWDEVNNTAIIRTDGVVEPIVTPTPMPIPTTTPVSTPTPLPTAPVPTGTPSPTNIIPGNPYYVNGLTCREDLSKFERLQGLLNYDDITSISGDENKEDLGRLRLGYGCWNPYQKRYEGYMSIDVRESSPSFMIRMGKGGEKEFQRLREIIDIGILGEQDYKDFIYNTVLSCKNGFAGGQVDYKDKTFFVQYNTAPYTKDIWGDEAFFVTVWGR